MKGSIVKKGQMYFCVYRIGGKQKWTKGGPTKKLAEKVLRDILHDIDNGIYKELKQITFEDFARLWLDTYAQTKVKPSTLVGYKVNIENHLVPYFGPHKLTTISTDMIQGYVARKLDTVKPNTVVNHLVPLKEMFKHS